MPAGAADSPPPSTLAERVGHAAVAGAFGLHAGPYGPLAKGWADARESALQAFARRRGRETFSIYVDGGSWASGKSVFAEDLERAFAERLGAEAVVRSEEDYHLHDLDGENELFAELDRRKPAVFIYSRSAMQRWRLRPLERPADYVVYVRATETARLWQFLKRQAEEFRRAPWLPPEVPGQPDYYRMLRPRLVVTRIDVLFATAEMFVRSAVTLPFRSLRYAARLLRNPPDLIVLNSLARQRESRDRFVPRD